MIETKKQKAVGLAPETAFETASHKPNPNDGNVTPQAECGKRAAVSAYCWGVLTIEACTRLFHRHPEWRGA